MSAFISTIVKHRLRNAVSVSCGLIPTPLLLVILTTVGFMLPTRHCIAQDDSYDFCADTICTNNIMAETMSEAQFMVGMAQLVDCRGNSIYTGSPYASNLLQNPIAPTQLWTSISNYTVVLNWAAVHIYTYAPSGYFLQIATDPQFSSTFYSGTVPNNTYVFTGSNNTTYYWQVASVFDGTGPFSGVQSATVSVDVTPPTLDPTTFSVSGGDQSVEFTWASATDASGVASYLIQVATDSAFNNIVAGQLILSNTNAGLSKFDTTILGPGSFYWRLQSTDVVGNISAFLSGPSFTIAPNPIDTVPPVIPATPVRVVSNDSITYLEWDPATAASGVNQYHLQIWSGTSATPVTTLIDQFKTNPWGSLTALAPGTYPMRVKAQDNAGNWSDWSPARRFSVNLPVISGLRSWRSLADMTKMSFTWDSPVNVSNVTYDFEIYNVKDPVFVVTPVDIQQTVITSTISNMTVGSLGEAPYASYYWRVRARCDSAGLLGPWSGATCCNFQDLQTWKSSLTGMQLGAALATCQDASKLGYLITGCNGAASSEWQMVGTECPWISDVNMIGSLSNPLGPVSGNCAAGSGNNFVVGNPSVEEAAFGNIATGTASMYFPACSPNFSASGSFGSAVAMDGLTAVVGAPGECVSGVQTGRAYCYGFSNGSWTEIGEFTSLGNSGDEFGASAAISGSTVMIGAPGYQSSLSNVTSGACVVYQQVDSSWWKAIQTITAPVGAVGFGQNVAVSGTWAVISSAATSLGQNGAAFVYQWNGSQWSLFQTIESLGPPSSEPGYGYRVAMQPPWIAVTSPDDASYATGAGAVYLFYFDGLRWSFGNKLTACTANAHWGKSVVFNVSFAAGMATDFSDMMIVGAPDDSSTASEGGSFTTHGMIFGHIPVSGTGNNAPLTSQMQLSQDVNGAVDVSWANAVAGGGFTCFEFQMDNYRGFTSPKVAIVTNSTSLTTHPLLGGNYAYRLRAQRAGGDWTDWSDTGVFSVGVSPTVTMGLPTGVTASSMVLNATVTPNGQPTSYFFQYGLDGSYGRTTGTQVAGSGTSAIVVSATIGGLSPLTPYHYRIVAASAGGTTSSFDGSFTTLAPSQAIVTVAGNPANGGTALGSGTYTIGSTQTISALPISGWVFTGWNDGNTQNSRTIGIPSGGAAYTANFQQTAAISVQASPAAAGTVLGSGTYLVGSSQTISASAYTGWLFGSWSDGSTQNPRSITVTTGGATYTANFLQAAMISLQANPANGGTLAGEGVYACGTNAVLSATPNNGFAFVNWTQNGTVVSSSASYSFTVSANETLVANFASSPTVLTGSATGPVSNGATLNGTVNPNGLMTTAYFQYGSTAAYGSVTTGQNAGSGITGLGLNASVSGLSPATIYHYRIVATNSVGTSYGSDQIFVTANGMGIYWSNFVGSPTGSGTTDGSGSSARFNAPRGVAVDGSGNIYVADYFNQTIRKITSSGVVTTLAGSAGVSGTANGTGGVARFKSPEGVAVDGSGNIYVADTSNQTIRKVTSSGVVTTLAGDPGFSCSFDGTGSGAGFCYPQGVAVDGSGNIYVADSNNQTIRKVTPSGVVTTVAGSAGTTGTANGTGSAARFNEPAAVVVDGSGNVYVADSNNATVRRMTSSQVVTTVAGSPGLTGTSDGTGNAALFNWPTGVTADTSGNIYVADAASNTIRMMTPGGVVTTIGGLAGVSGTADGPGSSARFSSPRAIAVSSFGIFYVADENNNRISKGVPTLITLPNPLPTVTTGGATGVASNGATLNGTVIPNGLSTTYYFQYGLTNAYTNTTGTQGAGSGTTAAAVSLLVTGLSPGTLYHYQVVAVSNGGTNYGLDQTFTTAQMASIAVQASPTACGSVSGGGAFGLGTTATVTAIPSSGYVFTNWSNNGTVVSTSASYTFTVNGSATLVGNFSLGSTILTSVFPTNGGTTGGGGTYAVGLTATVTATPSSGYLFSNWTNNGTVVSNSSSYAFTVNGNATLVANFVPGLILSTSASPSNGGSTSGDGTYAVGSTATVTATASSGFGFTNWTNNGSVVSSTQTYSFTLNGNTALVANFTAESPWTWSARNSGLAANLTGVAYGNGRFVAVGSGGAIATSADGVRWVAESSGTNADFSSITYGNGKFVAVGSGGAIVTSSDGMSWAVQNSGVNWLSIWRITCGNGLFVAVGSAGILTSTDGVAWVCRSSGEDLLGVAYGSGTFIAVGGTTMLTSADGVTWVNGSFGEKYIENIAYGAGTFVAAGGGGTLRSTDGVTWITTDVWADTAVVGFGGGSFVLMTDIGIYVSPDGVNWTAENLGVSSSYWLNASAYGNGVSVVVGDSGVILTNGSMPVSHTIATLSNLALSSGTLNPVFSSGVLVYSATVPNAVTSEAVTPTLSDSAASVTSITGTSGFVVGPNTITVHTLAQDGATSLTYSVTVTRLPSSIATLSNLALSSGTLNPVFSPGVLVYSATVANAVTSEVVTATLSDSAASVTSITGTSGFVVGPNTITVHTLAQDGATSLTYSVTVTRLPSSIATLSNLALSSGTLNPVCSPGVLAYSATVANAVTSETVAATLSDSTATVTSITGTSGFVVGANTITATVTAQDGVTQQVYTVVVTRLPSSNANLSGLALSSGTLSPAFSSGVLAYSATVGNAVTCEAVATTPSDSTATVQVTGGSNLFVGTNTITATVTAQDGVTQKIYTIVLTKTRLPLVFTETVSVVGFQTAVLNAQIDTNGSDTQVYFLYGPAVPYDFTTGTASIASGTGVAEISASVSNLTPAMLYHFQIIASNSSGKVFGADETFSTLAPDLVAEPVAASGDPVLQYPGTVIGSFGGSSIDDSGVAAFRATLSGAVIQPNNNTVLCIDSGSSSVVIARTGQAAPGGSGGVFASFGDAVLNNAHRIAFVGTLQPTRTINSKNNTGIWTNAAGSLTLLAQAGRAVPGCPAKTEFASFTKVVLPDDGGVVFLAKLTHGGGGVTAANDQGLWGVNSKGRLVLLIRKGAPLKIGAATKTVTGFSALASATPNAGESTFNEAGTVAVLASFSDRTESVLQVSRAGAIVAVASTHSDSAGIPGATVTGFADAELDGAKRTALRATVTGGGTTKTNNTGIWSFAGKTHTLLARTGKPAPGVPGGVFATLGNPVMNNQGRIAFIGTLNSRATGVWADTAGTVKPVAITGAQAPGCPAGAVFSAFQSFALPDQGGPVIMGTLAPGAGVVTSANNTGIWQADSNGTLRIIARTGDSIEIAGNVRFITAISIFNSTAETGAQPGGCNAHGDLIYRLTLDDGTQALITSIMAPAGK